MVFLCLWFDGQIENRTKTMKQLTCDLYIPNILDDYSPLEFLHLFESKFIYNPDQFYQGYLNVNIRRIALVNFVLEFRKRSMQIFNVPIQYRDHQNLSLDQAYEYACKEKDLEKYQIYQSSFMGMNHPLYFCFPLVNLQSEENVGGSICVDKLDGHIWSLDEKEEYEYDFNGSL